MSTILDLPTELVLWVLLNLSMDDIAALQLAHSYFHRTITNSTHVQYHLATQIAAVEDNQNSLTGLVGRLETLKAHEKAWSTLNNADWTQSLPPAQEFAGIIRGYADGFLFRGDYLQYLNLQSEEMKWKTIDLKNDLVISYGTAIYEYDLLVMLTRYV